MSGSGEQRLHAADDEVDTAEVVGICSSGRPRAEMKTPRRCVQTKLNFYMSPDGSGCGRGGKIEADETEEEGESSWSEDEGRRKPKRKRKAQSRTPKKAPMTSKEAVGFTTGSKKLLPPVTNGSDFFLKVSEKRLKQKHQRERGDVVDLTVEGDTCSKMLQSTCEKSYEQFQMQKPNFTPCKGLLSSITKESQFRWGLTSGKLSAAKDPSAQVLDKYQPNVHPCSESKNAEEGNVQASQTRATHPFFSSLKAAKRVSEFSLTTKVNKNYCCALDKDVLMSCRPMHVFEMFQDDNISLDWGPWKISERSLLDQAKYVTPESNLSPVSDRPIAPLKFDSTIQFSNLSRAILPHEEMHLDQFPEQAIDLSAWSGASAFLTDRRETYNQLVSYLKMFQGSKENLLFFRSTGSLDNERQDKPSQESLKLYQLHKSGTECSLWTNKYQPDRAVEVCGNTESVRFLCEWLKSWQERNLQTTKGSMTSNVYIDDDSDDSFYQNDSYSENEDDDSLGNVLLVTGPVGCGKSAAIYACAKEQGFQIIEVNASDERNGAHLKRKFGEAMDSHAIELRSTEDAVDLGRKHALPFMMESSVNTVAIKFKNETHNEASRLCKAPKSEHPVNFVGSQSSTCRFANKNLFLFEDVDAVLDEDHGFIATIMQLAETSKRPIVLTTNSKDPILPRALNKLVVDFTHPLTEELLAHIFMVCTAEGAPASPLLLERLIRSCQNDIRKTILHLQFWCQGERGQPDRNVQFTYSPLLFDLDAAHWVITKIIPWEIPCKLSLKVEEEISKSLSALAENLGIMHSLKEEDDMAEPIDALNTGEYETGTGTVRDIVLKSKSPISQNAEFLAPSSDHGEFSDDSESPLTFARRGANHRTDTVLSSQSGDVLAVDATIDFRCPNANSTLSPDACVMQSFQPVDLANCLNLAGEPFGEDANLSRDPFMIAEVASTSHVCDTYKSTCHPELSLVPETEITRNDGCLSMAVSSGHVSTDLEDFLMGNIGSIDSLSQAEVSNTDGSMLATNEFPANDFANIHEFNTESVHGNEEPGVSQKEAVVAFSRGYQLMDECSRAGFSMDFVSVDSLKCHPTVGSVEEAWRKLRNCHEDLKSCMTPGQKDAMKILDLALGLTDLISEADIFLRSCQSLTSDFLEPSTISFDEPCSSSWCDEHLKMASTFSQHGLCFYASKAATGQSNWDYENPVHLAREMLAASTSSMALGKLLTQKHMATNNLCRQRGSQTQPSKCGITLGRDLESMLCEAVRPIIPARLYMALKGPTFHEYVSFLSCMSKSENSRLSEKKDQFHRNRRARISRHYLQSHPFAFSPEDVSLMAGYGCFGEQGFR
uniref:ATPase family AAA domain-containing protein 5 n=1 Tax=Anthurium amnicola TaxID=1678845 RepID=A0A1D1Y003_9ARAE